MIEFDVDMEYLTDYGESDPPDTVILNDENGVLPSVEYVRIVLNDENGVRKEGSDD